MNATGSTSQTLKCDLDACPHGGYRFNDGLHNPLTGRHFDEWDLAYFNAHEREEEARRKFMAEANAAAERLATLAAKVKEMLFNANGRFEPTEIYAYLQTMVAEGLAQDVAFHKLGKLAHEHARLDRETLQAQENRDFQHVIVDTEERILRDIATGKRPVPTPEKKGGVPQ